MLGVGCQGKARRVLTYRDLQVRQTAMDLALESYKLAGLIKSSTRTRKLEFRGHGAHAKHVILRSPPFLLADDEGSPQFVGNVHPSADGLAVQRNCGDSSSVSRRTQNDTGQADT